MFNNNVAVSLGAWIYMVSLFMLWFHFQQFGQQRKREIRLMKNREAARECRFSLEYMYKGRALAMVFNVCFMRCNKVGPKKSQFPFPLL